MKHLITLLFSLVMIGINAQSIVPIMRFHERDSRYTFYNNNFLSGFMQADSHQSAANCEGFLQIPFVGNPPLVYVGEKDSTQFMAYASGYEFTKRDETTEAYDVLFTRYGVQAEVMAHPAYCVQQITFPDTTADKGFLLDIDHAGCGAINEDMDVVLIDKQTIRAYKRTHQGGVNGRSLYYVAHFSHPFHQWNVRREVVRLENGQREHRCKAAFVFDLKSTDKLTIYSAVSSASTDDAYAHLALKEGKRHFSDARRPVVEQKEKPLLAQQTAPQSATSKVQSTPSKQRVIPPSASTNKQDPSKPSPSTKYTPTSASSMVPNYLETATRNANLQVAFTSALQQLSHLQSVRKATNALALVDAITPIYKEYAQDAIEADSLLKQYEQSVFEGKKITDEQAVWFVFNALGFVPNRPEVGADFRIVRPMFNVVTMQLPHTRRFIMHVKNNAALNSRVVSASLMRVPLSESLTFSREQLQKGGVMELKMARRNF